MVRIRSCKGMTRILFTYIKIWRRNLFLSLSRERETKPLSLSQGEKLLSLSLRERQTSLSKREKKPLSFSKG